MLFQYGKAVTGDFFYDRKNMQIEIGQFLKMGQSFMIKAPRRFGKTSLIKHVLEKNKIDYFYVDFRQISRIEIFNDKLIEYIYSKMGIKGALKQLKNNAVSFLMQHKTTVGTNLDIFEASVELFSSKDINQVDRMIATLDMAENVASNLGERFYIVMDEFQDLSSLNADKIDLFEVLRGTVQHHHNTCYIFAGSNMTMMTEIFENSKSGFFNSCRKLKLKAFDIEELYDEVLRAFGSEKIVFQENNDLLNVLKKLNGHPANTMLVMQIIEMNADISDIKLIKNIYIDIAFDKALAELSELMSEYLKDIKAKEHLHDVIYRIANNEEQILEPSSLRQKRIALVNMGYLDKVGRGKYLIVDGFLEEELRVRNI